MKKLFALALSFALTANLNALSFTTKTSIKTATMCGDCGGPCGKPEKPEKADTI